MQVVDRTHQLGVAVLRMGVVSGDVYRTADEGGPMPAPAMG